VHAQLACVRVLALLTLSLLSGRSLARLAAAGAIPPLLALLRSSHTAGASTEEAAHLLRVLSAMAIESAAMREQLLHADALPLLRELDQHSCSASVQLHSAVSALQLQEEQAALLGQIPQVCARLLGADAVASKTAVVGLRKLLSIEREPPIEQIVATPGVVLKLVQMMRDSTDVEVQVNEAQ